MRKDLRARALPESAMATTEDRGVAVADLQALYRYAVETSAQAVATADDERRATLAALGEQIRAEQDSLFCSLMEALESAVRENAQKGLRCATILQFGGADKYSEFCYLYMIKGPPRGEQRAEMHEMGVKPLLHRLIGVLRHSGFQIHHAWQRATNENTLTVSW